MSLTASLPGVQANVGPAKFALNIAGGVVGWRIYEKYVFDMLPQKVREMPVAVDAVKVLCILGGCVLGNMVANKVTG